MASAKPLMPLPLIDSDWVAQTMTKVRNPVAGVSVMAAGPACDEGAALSFRKSVGGIEREARGDAPECIARNETGGGYRGRDGFPHRGHPGGTAGEKRRRHRVRRQ